ncbi:MAG: SMI1/KNR4 family protein [Anaerolineae bacterium]|nr:SMI1/KNR4 family protein [Anaerolineae bacterium]
MSRLVRQVLAPLDPYWDRIARRPLTAHSLARLEQGVGLALPDCLREYLEHVGMFQDLTYVEDNRIFVFETIPEYEAARSDLLDGLYGEIDMKLLPFGYDGAGNVFALLASGGEDADIFLLRQDIPEAQATEMTFSGWLGEVVRNTLATIESRTPNKQKSWRVQFTFRGGDFDSILQVMGQVERTALGSEWQHVETSQTGVIKSTAQVWFARQPLHVRRLEYPEWVSPWYFIDMTEPLEVNGTISTIQRLDDLFNEQIPGYGFINFGAVDQADGKADADA